MRLFIATTFPAAITDDLNARVAPIRSRLPSASWVRPETQHLTFAFLGERDEPLIDAIAPPLQRCLGGMPRFTASIQGCGLFPNVRRARVGWAGLQPDLPFVEIATGIRAVLTSQGVELDRAAFKPHLTLMRIRESWPRASVELFENTLRDYRSAPFTVDAVTLYSSRLSPGGAVHTPLRHFALA